MLKNYVLVALRILLKQKGYAAINIAGLAAGMACCCVIFLYVADELSYDRYHERVDRIYRLTMTSRLSGSDRRFSRTALPVAPVLAAAFPEIEAVVRLYGRSAGTQVLNGDAKPVLGGRFQEERFFFADSTVFRVFSFPLLKGDSATALAQPNSVVLTEETAHKYFGDADPMGHTLLFEGTHPMKVTGVARNLPDASCVHFDVLASFDMLVLENQSAANFLNTDWLFGPLYTFVLLREGVDRKHIEQQLPDFARRHANPQYADKIRFSLQSMADIHLYSEYTDEEHPNAITYVYIFSTIAILTLMVACINFINLSTARSFVRAREVGVRKALGAHRSQIVVQFLGEAFVIALAAFIISIALIELLLPGINELTEKHLSLFRQDSAAVLLGLAGIFLFTAFLAGCYPAFVISRLRPIAALRGGAVEHRASGGRLRRMLVVAQFAISIVLIAGAIIVSGQMTYMRSLPLGFYRDHVLTVPLFSEDLLTILGTPMTTELRSRTNAFEEALHRNPRVEAITLSSVLPGNGSVITSVLPEGVSHDIPIFISWLSVDYDFVQTYGLQILSGRSFSRQVGTDHLQAFIINEAAAKEFGWTIHNAVGKRLRRGDAQTGKDGVVVGVIRDFHVASLHERIRPMLMDVEPTTFAYFSIRVHSGDLHGTIAFIERTWKEFFPNRIFEYHFLNRQLESMYRSEEKLSGIIQGFALLAVFISCMGLLGLASFTTARRTKEIGVRKILGASVWNIVLLLVAEYTVLVLVAIGIALPVAWWGTYRWLEAFAYRIEPGPGMFIAAGAATLAIALLTVSWLSVRAALRNPAQALRYE